jgi:hypothetical protein
MAENLISGCRFGKDAGETGCPSSTKSPKNSKLLPGGAGQPYSADNFAYKHTIIYYYKENP